MSTFGKMIEHMEDLILAGIGVPFTPWTMVNGDKLVPLLDRIRESLPGEVRQAQMIIDRRDEVIADAQRKATQILEEAKIHAEAMVGESELMRAVHAEADRVRQQVLHEIEASRKKAFEEAEALKARAMDESKFVREGADRYAETILTGLEKSLTEFQTTVRNGQKHLKQARMDAINVAKHTMQHRNNPAAKSPAPTLYGSSPETEATQEAPFYASPYASQSRYVSLETP